ncbi:MAG: FixH family protein [Betaproteobacteria bacterium]|nr:FixH family protein [Betaproteobacteria bacterium]MDH5223068.1 FixH family protein [Betaproteobacteria bacterium]MDH5351088.1 FixH family protein [Betaproteobacteria bacterium]
MRLAALLALAAPAALACEMPGGPAEKLQSATHTILYRAEPGLGVGRHFALAVAVCPPPKDVRVDAWMPDHRHGMNYRPSIAPLGDGRYRADGLLFHMPGRWEFLFEVRGAGGTERFEHSVRVE